MSTNKAENSNSPEAKTEVEKNGRNNNLLPMVLSGLAVLIAALALIANQMGQPASNADPFEAMNSKLGQIEARIGDVESQVISDKMDGVQIQLKRILLDLEQLATVADDATRSKIDQAYHLLKPLSMPATAVKAEVDMQSTTAPENQSQLEEAFAPAPAEEAAPPTPPVVAPEATSGAMEEPAMPTSEPAAGEATLPETVPSSDLPSEPAPAGEAGQAQTLEPMPPFMGN